MSTKLYFIILEVLTNNIRSYFLKIIESLFNEYAFLTQHVCHCGLFTLHITSTFIFTVVCVNIKKNYLTVLSDFKIFPVECVQDGIPL